MTVRRFLRRRRAPRPVLTVREVGACGACMGPLFFDAAVLHASCPCGMTVIPRRFLIVAAAGSVAE